MSTAAETEAETGTETGTVPGAEAQAETEADREAEAVEADADRKAGTGGEPERRRCDGRRRRSVGPLSAAADLTQPARDVRGVRATRRTTVTHGRRFSKINLSE